MNHSLLNILSVCALASFVSAKQVGSPPGISKGTTFSTDITVGASGTSGFSTLNQISHQRLGNDTPGNWTTCLSGGGLSSANGGAGSNDVLIGRWDRVNKKFTRTLQAAKLNSVGFDFGLMLDATGRHAVLDWPRGAMYAFRPAPGMNFPVPNLITGVTGTYVDPALGVVNKKLMLFFVRGTDIVMQELDVSTATSPRVKGAITIVVNSIKAGGTANSPTPITGEDGDVEALFAADVVSPDNDMTWCADLKSATPAIMLVNTSNWINNGGVAGGMLTFANANQVSQIETAWIIGDDELIGQTANITAAVVKAGKGPAITILLLAAKEIAPVPKIGNFFGNFALDLATLLVLPGLVHLDAGERTKNVAIPIPNDARLKNKRVAIQGLSLDTNGPKMAQTFTNTAFLYFR